MPNWQETVRQRLSGLALEAAEKDEIHAELARHLEESYELFCQEGLTKREAVQRTLGQVADWQDLQRKILIARRREQPMEKRAHQLWIPGFLTLTLSMILLITFQKLGFQPRIVGSGPNLILFYAPWLAASVTSILWGSGSLPLGSARRFAGNRASCQRFSRARAYCGVSLDVSDRLRHRRGHRKTCGWRIIISPMIPQGCVRIQRFSKRRYIVTSR
jgi:hypothetical protein